MQANIYLDYEGLKGEATASKYKDMITVNTLNFYAFFAEQTPWIASGHESR